MFPKFLKVFPLHCSCLFLYSYHTTAEPIFKSAFRVEKSIQDVLSSQQYSYQCTLSTTSKAISKPAIERLPCYPPDRDSSRYSLTIKRENGKNNGLLFTLSHFCPFSTLIELPPNASFRIQNTIGILQLPRTDQEWSKKREHNASLYGYTSRVSREDSLSSYFPSRVEDMGRIFPRKGIMTTG